MVLTSTSIHSQIREYIAQNILFSEAGFAYGDDDSFVQEGIIDSLGVMELVLFVEKEFGICIEDEDVTPDNLDSINRLASYVQRKLV